MKSDFQAKPIRVLLWAPLGAGTHYWGPGTSAFRLFRAWKAHPRLRDTIKIDLVHGEPDQGSYPDVFNKTIFISNVRKISSKTLGVFLWKSLRWIYLNRKSYDVVYGLSLYEYTSSPCWFARLLGLPVVVKSTGTSEGLSKSNTWRDLLQTARRRRWMAKRFNRVVALSNEMREQLQDYGLNPCQVKKIPNGVDTDRFSPLSSEIKANLRRKLGLDDVLTVIFVGGLSERKRPDLLIKAGDLLAQEKQAFQILIVGPVRDQRYIESFQQILSQTMVPVRVLPNVADIEKYYQVADIFVLPSAREGMSNALLEAMATGLVPIVTPVSGATDLVTEGYNGFFCEQNEHSIFRKISACMSSPADMEGMGQMARQTILSEYSYEFIIEEYLKLFQSARLNPLSVS